MKKAFSFFLTVCVLLGAFSLDPVLAAELSGPSLAASEMLAAISSWKQGEAISSLHDAEQAELEEYLKTFGGAIEHLAGRMNYKVYAHKITGSTAIVDVSVSAVTLRDVAGPLLAQSATYVAFRRLIGKEADLNAYLAERIAVLIEEEPTVAANVSMHLLLGGDGSWKLDLSNEKNISFLDALCGGGILPYMEAIKALVEWPPTGE